MDSGMFSQIIKNDITLVSDTRIRSDEVVNLCQSLPGHIMECSGNDNSYSKRAGSGTAVIIQKTIVKEVFKMASFRKGRLAPFSLSYISNTR